MYRQMNCTELVANDSEEYVNIAVRLLKNQSYQDEISHKILDLFQPRDIGDRAITLQRNTDVSTEWANFFRILMGRKK